MAEIAGGGLGHEIELTAEPGQPRITRIDGKPAAQIALAGLLRIVWLVPAQDRLWIEGSDGRRRFLDRIAMSFRPEHAEAALTHEKAMRERNRLLKEGVSDPRWYGALESQMAEAAVALTANRREAIARIAAAQEGAATAFPAARLWLEADESRPPFFPFFLIGLGLLAPFARIPLIFFLSSFLTVFLTELLVLELRDEPLLGALLFCLLSFLEDLPLEVLSFATSLSMAKFF
jgi:hypothetical protein